MEVRALMGKHFPHIFPMLFCFYLPQKDFLMLIALEQTLYNRVKKSGFASGFYIRHFALH